jgi:hypothetical protein
VAYAHAGSPGFLPTVPFCPRASSICSFHALGVWPKGETMFSRSDQFSELAAGKDQCEIGVLAECLPMPGAVECIEPDTGASAVPLIADTCCHPAAGIASMRGSAPTPSRSDRFPRNRDRSSCFHFRVTNRLTPRGGESPRRCARNAKEYLSGYRVTLMRFAAPPYVS